MSKILEEVNAVFEIEISELEKVRTAINQSMEDVIQLINGCRGKVVLCGMGKPGHVAHKISASMSSMGIPSYTLHPAEAQHGDLGTLTKDDIIIFISNSGETSEICRILPNIRMMGVPMVGITSNGDSTMAQYMDYCITLPRIKEASSLGLAPTSSTTVAMVVGDAIAVVVSKMRDFKKEDFAIYHPAGALGKKLLTKVDDIMISGNDMPIVSGEATLFDALSVLCDTGVGGVMVSDDKNKLIGLVTDGDLKRYFKDDIEVYSKQVKEIMTHNPISACEGMLAVDALRIMENRNKPFTILPILSESQTIVGIVRMHDILQRGIFV